MKFYLWFALLMCRITGTSPSFLLHPLDLIGGDKIKQLAFFPGMNIESRNKSEVFKYVIRKLKKKYRIVTMEGHAHETIDRVL